MQFASAWLPDCLCCPPFLQRVVVVLWEWEGTEVNRDLYMQPRLSHLCCCWTAFCFQEIPSLVRVGYGVALPSLSAWESWSLMQWHGRQGNWRWQHGGSLSEHGCSCCCCNPLFKNCLVCEYVSDLSVTFLFRPFLSLQGGTAWRDR